MQRRFLVRNADNPARVIEGEAVIVTPEDSQLHTLNEVGTFIWERADGTHSIEAIVDAICRSFEVPREQAQADVEAFVATCLAKRLLALSDAPDTRGDGGGD